MAEMRSLRLRNNAIENIVRVLRNEPAVDANASKAGGLMDSLVKVIGIVVDVATETDPSEGFSQRIAAADLIARIDSAYMVASAIEQLAISLTWLESDPRQIRAERIMDMFYPDASESKEPDSGTCEVSANRQEAGGTETA